LQTLLPKTRTLFCRLSSRERSRVCQPYLADCHLPKRLTTSITSKQTTCQLISRHVVSLKTRFPRCPNVSGKLFHPRESFPRAGPNVMCIFNSQPITFRPDLRTKVDTAVLCCLAHPPLQLSPRSGTSRHWALRLELARTSPPDVCGLFC